MCLVEFICGLVQACLVAVFRVAEFSSFPLSAEFGKWSCVSVIGRANIEGISCERRRRCGAQIGGRGARETGYIYMYMYMYYMCIYIYICMYIIYIYIYIYMCRCTPMMCIYIYIYIRFVYTHIYIYIYIYMFALRYRAAAPPPLPPATWLRHGA